MELLVSANVKPLENYKGSKNCSLVLAKPKE